MSFSATARLAVNRTLILLMMMLASVDTSAENRPEDRIKAAFIFNFIKFTEWPDNDQLTEFKMCISGNPSLSSELENLQGKQVRGKPITILKVENISEFKDCQILFFGKNNTNRIHSILVQLAKYPVLTIADINDFTNKGGIIQFFLENSRLRFEINKESIELANLTISSKLLSLSRKNKTRATTGQ